MFAFTGIFREVSRIISTFIFLTNWSDLPVPQTRGAMDSRIDALEKNMEAMRQKMEERDERVNHQMEDLKNMFASLMTKLSSDPTFATFDRDKGGGLGLS